MSQAWLALLVPVALMTAAVGLQRLEHHLLGPAPSIDENPTPRRGARPTTAS